MKKREKDQGFSRKISFRVTGKESGKLDQLLEKSTSRTLSSMLRKIIFQGELQVLTVNPGPGKIVEELAAIRKEIRAIGVNINQVTRRFHTERSAEARLLSAMELTALYQQTDEKITKLFDVISKIAAEWSQES